jgi:hypothetical protein
MKVTYKVVIALFLAAQLNLVSANENVFSMEAVKTAGGDNYIEKLKEVKIRTPMTFTDVVVVAPDLKSRKTRFIQLSQYQINFDDLSSSPEVVFQD